jgi:hypothetical protein
LEKAKYSPNSAYSEFYSFINLLGGVYNANSIIKRNNEMILNLKKSAFVVVTALYMAGCQNNAILKKGSQDSALITASDPAMLQLVSIAQNLHKRTSINDQILTKRYDIKDEQRIPINDLPASLKKLTSYPGGTQLPLETALREMAAQGNIDYLTAQGKKPIAGIPIVFDGQFRTVAEYIADIGRQTGYRADVLFNITAVPRPSVQIIYKGSVL